MELYTYDTGNTASINQIFTFLGNRVRVFGTTENPWFSGKDVAVVLGYKYSDKAIKAHVKDKCKRVLKALTGPSDLCGLTYNELNSFFINEAGVYSLIFRSKLDLAEKFQDWVFETVLPSIRKTGKYQINSQIKFLQEQVHLKDKEIRKQKTGNILLKNYVDNIKSRDKESILYIATSNTYASQNNFKIGGGASNKLLKGRLATYNSGRPQEDQLYFAAIFKCSDYRQMESRIKDLLFAFKKNTEMYIIHYESLFSILEFMVENYSKEIDKLNEFHPYNSGTYG